MLCLWFFSFIHWVRVFSLISTDLYIFQFYLCYWFLTLSVFEEDFNSGNTGIVQDRQGHIQNAWALLGVGDGQQCLESNGKDASRAAVVTVMLVSQYKPMDSSWGVQGVVPLLSTEFGKSRCCCRWFMGLMCSGSRGMRWSLMLWIQVLKENSGIQGFGTVYLYQQL